MGDHFTIRMAKTEDARELLDIYAPYIMHTAVSFECTVPTVEEFEKRIAHTLEKYPYLVAVCDGRITGYAYVSALRGRKAADWAVETSIYIAQDQKRHGYGKALYAELEEILKKQNIQNMYACIAYTDTEDEYLVNDSMHFHEQQGYQLNGHLHQCGYKFGRWYDLIWMEKMIGSHPADVEPLKTALSALDKRVALK